VGALLRGAEAEFDVGLPLFTVFDVDVGTEESAFFAGFLGGIVDDVV
jgi:hypothetical protein